MPTDPNNLQANAYQGTSGPPAPPLLDPDPVDLFHDWQFRWVADESRAGRLAGYTAAQFQEAAFVAGFRAGTSQVQ